MTGIEKLGKALVDYWKFGLLTSFVLLLMLLFDELAMWIPGPVLVGFLILILIVALRFLSLYQARQKRRQTNDGVRDSLSEMGILPDGRPHGPDN